MAYIELENVSFCYPGQSRPVLREINLSIFNKGVTAITGANGSGKTTFSKLLTGILTPTKGRIKLNGQLLTSLTLAQIGRQIGYVFQNPDKQLFCETVEEEIDFGVRNLGLPPDQAAQKVREVMDYFELTRHAQAYPLSLSAGEKRRLALAAVFALEPGLLLLDEPTTGLDPYRKKVLGDYLDKVLGAGRGVVLISHDQKFINRYATRLIGLRDGQFIEE
ncbi:Energy-coupling factor transporter ATP-binding protein EcfA2 [Pelotomaculum schinkii]|uniref:Energy-coupling factor transporter ATP-binding protein EcfA2 n=1 Tax=Pelotomaculum schinkii TaxID=78350 RepID=A0A4Y7RGE1_9FIRM|nr:MULTISPECIES: ABC transporter ATP-binding protein [Pelotomaculum]TEB08078.1 Energy-coupling factor transporter ATP-binding protein EcfA2 [Pelotomaculum schinkii]TEB15770.1 Energy-coupling factor transporter ATP-binding protein EcfA2 [Pelotomaculum sp. FP]